jgi:hypothetical protein
MQVGLKKRLRYRSSLFDLIHQHAHESLYNDQFVRPQLDGAVDEQLEDELDLAQDGPLPTAPERQRRQRGRGSLSSFWQILDGPSPILKEEMAPVRTFGVAWLEWRLGC